MIKTDQQLIKDYLKGDKKSIEALIKHYLAPVYCFVLRRIGNKEEAEDVTQDVFVKVWKNLKKFDQKKSFKAWIFTIAKNASIDYLRKKKTAPFSSFENGKGENTLIETLKNSADMFGEISGRQNTALIIGQLPENTQKTMLFKNSGFNFREISEMTGESINTIKSRYRRTLIALKKKFN